MKSIIPSFFHSSNTPPPIIPIKGYPERLPIIHKSGAFTSFEIKKKLCYVAAYTLLIGSACILFYTTAKISAIVAIMLTSKELIAAVVSLTSIGSITVFHVLFKQGFKIKRLGISFGFQPWKEASKTLQIIPKIKAQQALQNYRKNNPLASAEQSLFFAWQAVTQSTYNDLRELTKEIESIKEKIKTYETNPFTNDLRSARETLASHLTEFYSKIVREYAVAKIYTAYYHYVLSNPTQNDPIQTFVKFNPPSCLEALQMTSLEKKQGRYLFGSIKILYSDLDQQYKGWTIQQLIDMDDKSLSKKIFKHK